MKIYTLDNDYYLSPYLEICYIWRNYCLRKNEDYNKLRSIKVYAIVNYSLFNNDIKNKVYLKNESEIFTTKLEYQIFDLTKVDIIIKALNIMN